MHCPAFPALDWWQQYLLQPSAVSFFPGVIKDRKLALNRYQILTASGPILLSIPLKGGRERAQSLTESRIDYTHDWQRQHSMTLRSAYGRAPFFEYYGPELLDLILTSHEVLLDFNSAALNWAAKILGVSPSSSILGEIDQPLSAPTLAAPKTPVYHQVFEDRIGFYPNPSIIDLVMAEGPYASAVLS